MHTLSLRCPEARCGSREADHNACAGVAQMRPPVSNAREAKSDRPRRDAGRADFHDPCFPRELFRGSAKGFPLDVTESSAQALSFSGSAQRRDMARKIPL